MSDKRNGLDQARHRLEYVLHIMLNTVLLEVFRPLAAAMAAKADGCARNAKVKK